MQPEINLGPLTLQTFGIMFALAFLAGGGVIARRLNEWGKPADWAYEIVFAGLVGGIVGARLYYIVQNYDLVKHDLLGNLFSGSGLVWYGGLLGAFVAVPIWAKFRGFLDMRLLDLMAVSVPLGYAIGRIGCQLSGDGDYGKPWNGPWAMAYPKGTVPTQVTVHPTPIYETLAMGTAALVLWHLRDRFRTGVLWALFMVIAGLERFLVEFIRRNDHVFAGLTAPQLESLGMAVIGVVWLAIVEHTYGTLRPNAAPRHPAG